MACRFLDDTVSGSTTRAETLPGLGAEHQRHSRCNTFATYRSKCCETVHIELDHLVVRTVVYKAFDDKLIAT